jgi:hypothetical protein
VVAWSLIVDTTPGNFNIPLLTMIGEKYLFLEEEESKKFVFIRT